MKLVCIEGQEQDRVWELAESIITIGRDASCDIAIDDSELSRVHAEIVREGDTRTFFDKESMNGSFVNNRRVKQKKLKSGDLIRIGSTKIRVLEEGITANINWQEGESLITSKVPLNLLTNQVKETVTSPEITKAYPKFKIKKQPPLEKLLRNLKIIYEAGKVINSIQTLDELFHQIGETLLDVFVDVQRVCILLKEEGKDLEPKFILNRPNVLPHLFQISRSIVEKSVKEEVCILANDAFRDGRFLKSESIARMNLRSFMCAPLISKGNVLGLIYLDNREKPDCFDENDVTLLSALANQSAIAIENSRLYGSIQKAYHEAILALLNTVEAKDPYTRGHSQRTSHYALGIAQEMGLSEEECERIKTAAEVHDIGKIGVRDYIIDKNSTLSTTEFHSIQAHAVTGENILKPIEYLSYIFPMVRSHHEKYDGSGYPDGLKGDKIPLGARIIGAADAFDAMTTQRPYNEPLSFEKALKKCQSLKGKQFDPDAVDALVRFITKKLG
jgi:HD-GYP domain-containing protein (c-di-GMP phosphodiesterase class II)